MAVPDTIDPRAINKAKNGKITIFKKHENLTLAINSAKVDFLISFDLARSNIVINILYEIMFNLFSIS